MILGTYANLYAMEKSSNSRTLMLNKVSVQIDSVAQDLVDTKVPVKVDNLKQPGNARIFKGMSYFITKNNFNKISSIFKFN